MTTLMPMWYAKRHNRTLMVVPAENTRTRGEGDGGEGQEQGGEKGRPRPQITDEEMMMKLEYIQRWFVHSEGASGTGRVNNQSMYRYRQEGEAERRASLYAPGGSIPFPPIDYLLAATGKGNTK
jgi:hypothetical protein